MRRVVLEWLRGRDGAGPLSLPLFLLPGSEPWLSCGQWPHHLSPPSSCGPWGQLLPVTVSSHRQQCESGLEHTEPCNVGPADSSLLAHYSQSSSSWDPSFPCCLGGRKEIMRSRGLGGAVLGAFPVESSLRQAAQYRI